MIPLAVTVFVASLLGSLHCAGMCGGFVAFYSGGRPRRGRVTAHLAYSGGRLGAYAGLGALAGSLGAALDATGALLGLQRAAAVVAGALIALWGGVSLAESFGARVPALAAPPAWRGLLSRGVAHVAARPPAERALIMGLLTGCLPCGWLYAFVVTAAGSGSALAGAGTMALFWLGTLPVMIGLGVGVTALAGPLRRHVPAACAVAMIAVGLLAVAGRFRPVEPLPRAAGDGAITAPAHEHGHAIPTLGHAHH